MRGILLHLFQIFQRHRKENLRVTAGKRDCIEQLITGVRHVSIHLTGIVIRLYHTEIGCVLSFIRRIQPQLEFLLQWHLLRQEFQILQTALGDDQLDIRHIACSSESGKLTDLLDIVRLKPPLQIGVERAGFKESVA